MLVVNRGLSGAWHILRGSDAREFLNDIEIVSCNTVVLILPAGRKVKAQLMATMATTFILVMSPEDLSNAVAQLAFSQALKLYNKRLRRNHGPA